MFDLLFRNWWTLAIRGAIAILFGIAVMVLPGLSLGVFLILLATFALLGGLLMVIAAFRERADHRWWILLLLGLAGLAVGIITLLFPTLAALILLALMATWAIATGILELIAAIQLRRELDNEWLLAIAGVASIIFGILLVIRPGAGILAILWIIGIYAIAIGVLQLVLAFRLRVLGKRRFD